VTGQFPFVHAEVDLDCS